MVYKPITLAGGIVSQVFETFLNWIATLIGDIYNGLGKMFTNLSKPDLATFTESFPFLKVAYDTILTIGLGLLFLIVIFQLFKALGGKVTDSEDPMLLVLKAGFFIFLMFYSTQIFDIIIDIALVPVGWLEGLEVNGEALGEIDWSALGPVAIANIIATLFSGAGLLIAIVASVVLLWNYLKLLLEICERYVVWGVLYYTAPLAFALGPSKATSDSFKNWCRMVGSQLFIIVMNIYFIKGFGYAVGVFSTRFGTSVSPDNIATPVFGYFCLLAYLRVASRFDEYLGQLGLNAAKTGTGPLGAVGTAIGLRPLIGAIGGALGGNGFFGGKSGGYNGGGSGAASKVLGVGGIGTIPNKVGKAFDPSTYVNNALGGKREGVGGLAGVMANAAGRAYVAKNGLNDIGRISDFANNAQSNLNSIGGKAAMNDAQMFMPSMFNKQGLTYDADSQLNSAGKMQGKFTDGLGNSYGMVATSMRVGDAPEGPYGIARAADGSGFYVQAVDKDGVASEQGTAALFGAPSIGDNEGQIASANFGAAFFPGSEDVTDGLTFSNDADDPFTLNAVDENGNTFAFRSGAGYEMPDDAVDGMSIVDSNGQTWYAQDTTPINTSGIEEGVTVGGDGTVYDSFGNEVDNSVLASLGTDMSAPVIGEDGLSQDNFAETFFPNSSEQTEGLTFSNVDGDPYSITAVDENGEMTTFRNGLAYGETDGEVLTSANGQQWYEDTGIFENDANADSLNLSANEDNPYVMLGTDADGNNVGYMSSAVYDMPEGISDDSVLTDRQGVAWFPMSDEDVAYANQPNWQEDAGTFANDSSAEGYSLFSNEASPNVLVGTDAEGNEIGYMNSSAYDMPDGVDKNSLLIDKNGVAWFPMSSEQTSDYNIGNIANEVNNDGSMPINPGKDVGSPFANNDNYYAKVNPVNPYEAVITDSEGHTGTYRNSAQYGVVPGSKEEDSITDKFGNAWYPVNPGSNPALQKNTIERSNQSVAQFFGLDSNNIQYADTSRSGTDGIISVHNKDGTSQMYVSEKGKYEVNGNSKPINVNGQTWYQVDGIRGTQRIDTGKRRKDGSAITKEIGSVKYEARISQKKNNPLISKFAPIVNKKTRGKGKHRRK